MGGEAVRIGWRLGAALALAAGLAACSFAVPGFPDDRAETTGSIGRIATSPLSPDLGQEDWRRAKGALAIALDPQGSGAEVKWDNPDTEASGTFTPVGQPFVKADEVCRVFLATLTLPGRSSTLQGTACRPSAEEWRINDVRPWRKPA